MENKRRAWTIGAIIVAILLFISWIYFNHRVENAVHQESQDVIEDLTID